MLVWGTWVKVETPEGHYALDKINNFLTGYGILPPSAQAADILEHAIAIPGKFYGGADVVISLPDKED